MKGSVRKKVVRQFYIILNWPQKEKWSRGLPAISYPRGRQSYQFGGFEYIHVYIGISVYTRSNLFHELNP